MTRLAGIVWAVCALCVSHAAHGRPSAPDPSSFVREWAAGAWSVSTRASAQTRLNGVWVTDATDLIRVGHDERGVVRLALGELRVWVEPGRLIAWHAAEATRVFVVEDDAASPASLIAGALPPLWCPSLAFALGPGSSALPVVGRETPRIQWTSVTSEVIADSPPNGQAVRRAWGGTSTPGPVTLRVDRSVEDGGSPARISFDLEYTGSGDAPARRLTLESVPIPTLGFEPAEPGAWTPVGSLRDLRRTVPRLGVGDSLPPEFPVFTLDGRAWSVETAAVAADVGPLRTDAVVVLVFDGDDTADASGGFEDAVGAIDRSRRWVTANARELGLPVDERSGTGTARVAIGAVGVLDPGEEGVVRRLGGLAEEWDRARGAVDASIALAWSSDRSGTIERLVGTGRPSPPTLVVLRRNGQIAGVLALEGLTRETLGERIADAITPWRGRLVDPDDGSGG